MYIVICISQTVLPKILLRELMITISFINVFNCFLILFIAGQVFGPLEFSRRDLAALNIQRARDHGLTDYQTIRETFGLPRLNSWEEINTQNNDTIRVRINILLARRIVLYPLSWNFCLLMEYILLDLVRNKHVLVMRSLKDVQSEKLKRAGN